MTSHWRFSENSMKQNAPFLLQIAQSLSFASDDMRKSHLLSMGLNVVFVVVRKNGRRRAKENVGCVSEDTRVFHVVLSQLSRMLDMELPVSVGN